MCGIVAFIDFSKKISVEQLDVSTDTMELRGPDSRGTLLKNLENYNIGFGHRRLAIIDIDERSNQPFVIDHLTMVFNGEIYNFNEIKSELIQLGFSFRTTSDTEVILQSYIAWGKNFVDKFIGMFAFFIYDSLKEEVIIVRDRLGVKPLYIYHDKEHLIVASQISAIPPLLDLELSVDENSVYAFFSLGYIPGELSIYKEIKKVKPASINVIKLKEGIQSSESIYWEINNLNSNLTQTEKTTKLESLLKDAIGLRQISDVKVGSFLSGGLDSSYVTKIMHENSKDLNTFTIGFKEKFDEAPHAQKVADFIGTKHHSIYLEASDVKDIILDFTKYFDEPFSDDAAIPMLFLSREAKKTVKVVISSDGGDEVFAGYSRYIKVLKTHEMLNRTPDFVLNFLKSIVKISIQFLPKQSKLVNNLWRFKNIITKDKYKRLSNLIFFADRIPTPELNKVLDNKITKTEFSHNFYQTKNNNSPLKNLLYIDLKESLVNQMLVKVDKSTMGASIEGREPLLDHRLFEFMASCSDEDLIKDQKTKYLFRKIINKEFNDSEILNKPKLGFNTPIYNWLCFSFDSYVEEEFRSINELKIPYLKQEELLNMWSEFKLGKIYYQNLIWRSLIWVQWYKRYKANL